MDINKLMQQAQAMQKKIEETTNAINEKEFTGEASNGLVKITINGEYTTLNVDIDPSVVVVEDKDMLQDLIMIAFNNAKEKVDECKKEQLGSMASALNLPLK